MSDKNPIFAETAQAVIDRHLGAIMVELAAVGLKPVGVVAGVLHDGETSVNWCVSSDESRTDIAEDVAREIARDIEASSREEP